MGLGMRGSTSGFGLVFNVDGTSFWFGAGSQDSGYSFLPINH
jgi:hypothetical protein